MTKYGYLVPSDPRTGNLRPKQDLEKAVKMLQRFAGLPETGQLDEATLKQMSQSRCGVADFGKTDNMRRKKRYTLQGTYWKKKVMHLGYPLLRKIEKHVSLCISRWKVRIWIF